MSTTEERRELIDGAAKLQAELQKFNTQINGVINALLSQADMLKIDAANAITSGDSIKKTKVVYKAAVAAIEEPSEGASPPAVNVILGAGKRACSICRKPGHRAQNCPDANKKYQEDRKK